MHLQTHLMSGWCAANLLNLTARERFLAMLMAVAPDLDGVTYVSGAKAYWATHHIYGHNLLYLIALAGILTLFCQHRLKSFALFMVIGHLHLVMDLLGSGEGGASLIGCPLTAKSTFGVGLGRLTAGKTRRRDWDYCFGASGLPCIKSARPWSMSCQNWMPNWSIQLKKSDGLSNNYEINIINEVVF